jgi:uncharacterized membrane protein YdjX (TVP38/TMEM64 family)
VLSGFEPRIVKIVSRRSNVQIAIARGCDTDAARHVAYAGGVEHQHGHVLQEREATEPPAHKGLGRAAPVAVVATVLPISGSVAVVAVGLPLAYWLRAQGTWGVFYFTLAFAILGALALAPTYSTSIIAGWTFGFATGFPAVVIGTVGGATLCYIAARKFAAERVHSTFVDHPKWEVIRRALAEETWGKTLWIVFLMRLSPVLPFGTTNVLMATTGVPLPIYVFGTILGLMPRMAIVALAAAGAENLDFKKGESWWVLGFGLLATGVCIALIAMIGKRALERATRSGAVDASSP